jgi:regulator of replication initiation timing
MIAVPVGTIVVAYFTLKGKRSEVKDDPLKNANATKTQNAAISELTDKVTELTKLHVESSTKAAEEITSLRKQLSDTQETLTNENDDLSKQVVKLRKEIEGLKATMKSLTKENERLRAERNEAVEKASKLAAANKFYQEERKQKDGSK